MVVFFLGGLRLKLVQRVLSLLIILLLFIPSAIGPSLASAEAISPVFSQVSQPIYVTHAGDDGAGSLRWAIAQANQTPESDLIDLSRVSGTITLHSGLPTITSDLFVIGDNNVIISGNRANRVLSVKQADVALHNLTIRDGLAQGANGQNGAGGSAGIGGGLLMEGGTVILSDVSLINNQAIGGDGTDCSKVTPSQIDSSGNDFEVNRGAIIGINGVSLTDLVTLDLNSEGVTIGSNHNKFEANRGAIAGINGIGIEGIGSIAFGGGGGFGGFGNAGNGGNGGNGGVNEGNGGNGGDGGNGGVGIFGSFGQWEGQGGIGAIAFGGGGGVGGFGNAGNGGNGGNAVAAVANGGNGGSGGNGGFGGGGGSGGFGGNGGSVRVPGKAGRPGEGGFGGGNGVERGGGGAGFGGAIFVRSGRLILSNTMFEHNVAIGGTGANPGQGKGGAIFIVPESLSALADTSMIPRVISLKQLPAFVENTASDAGRTTTDNADIYGMITTVDGRHH